MTGYTGPTLPSTGVPLVDGTIRRLVDWLMSTPMQGHLNSNLADISDLTPADGTIIVGNGTDWVAESGATARASLGLAIGTNVQAWDADLDTLAGLAKTDGNFIVGDGAAWVVESGATARTSLGLGTIATQSAASVAITGGSITGITDLAVADGGTGASTAADARTNLGLVIGTNVQAFDAQLTDVAGLAVTDGNFIVGNGTNFVAESGATARTSLGVAIGSDVQAFDADLSAIAALATTGMLARTGAGTAAARTITAGTGISVANGDGVAGNPTISATGAQTVAQVVNTQTGAVATGTTTIPLDDTVPQNTEGDEYMTLAVTPTDAANVLLIDVSCNVSSTEVGPLLTAALFQDSTAGALATAFGGRDSAATGPTCITFRHKMTAGTISATTFKVRVGAAGAGTTTFNGQSGARRYGGTMASSITITEVVP